MKISSWLKTWKTRRSSHHGSAKLVSSEVLETRSLLSVSALFIAGGLEIVSDADDGVRVSSIGGNLLVETAPGGGFFAPYPGLGTIPAASVTTITIDGGDEENTIDLSNVLATNFLTLTSIVVRGHNGGDTITGSPDFADDLSGDDGQDTITGLAGNDTIHGGDGVDSIQAGGGNDSVLGGDGGDLITTGGGNDTVDGGNGSDSVDLGDGNDSLFGGNGEDTVAGGDGNDTLNGDGGTDQVNGNGGDDSILGGELNDILQGGDGNDTINGQAGVDTIDGEGGDDSLKGGDSGDLIIGNDGNDIINGEAGDDTLFGDGNDGSTVAGGDGNDSILGGAGNDSAEGGFGNDTIRGNGGDDTLCGTFGLDNIDGNAGDDEVSGVCLDVQPIGISIGDVNVEEGGSADVVLIVDQSGSTAATFGGTPVGDVNNDGLANTILDAELASLLAFQADLIARNVSANLALISFDTASIIYDMNPVQAGQQLVTSPTADNNANGITDFEEIVRSIQIQGGTAFEPPLQDAITVFTALNTPVGAGTLAFLSDGQPFDGPPFNVPALYQDEVTTLQGLGVDLRAFGVGTGAFLPALQIIDPTAAIFTSSDALAMALSSIGVTAQANQITLALSSAPPVPFSIDFSTAPLTATAGQDYQAVTGTVVFAAGQTTGIIPIGIFGDNIIEVPETFTITLSNLTPLQFSIQPFVLIDDTGLVTIYDAGSVVPPSPPPAPVPPLPTAGRNIDPNPDTLFGSDGNDTILGDLGPDFINAGAGDDSIDAGSGDDSVLGGSGADTINGEDGDDTLNGQGGTDILDGGAGHDTTIWEGAGSGNDVIGDVVGDNTLIVNGTNVANTFNVGQNLDHQLTVTETGIFVTVGATFNRVLINGNGGNDTINVGLLKKVAATLLEVHGGLGNDTLTGSGALGNVRVLLDGGDGNDSVVGGEGDETITGGLGIDALNGGAGNDTISGGDDNDFLDGGLGNDSLSGDVGTDSLRGNSGNDVMSGGDDNDSLDGGDGLDTMNGNAGNDSLIGNLGNDSLLGDVGLDTLNGGDGNDVLDGGRNDDSLTGGLGDDKIRGDHGNDTITGDDGNDTINGGDGNDNVQGGNGNDGINGGNGNDLLNGNAGNDTILGGDGADTLRGGGGADIALGEDGNDNIDGQAGADTVAGNEGTDVIADPLAEINEAFVLSNSIRTILNAA